MFKIGDIVRNFGFYIFVPEDINYYTGKIVEITNNGLYGVEFQVSANNTVFWYCKEEDIKLV
jgi:hypothetical protein